MLKKNSNKKNSAADDLLSSLLEDVDQFDASSDEKLELEPTVYGTPKKKDLDVSSDFLLPSFDQEKSAINIGLSQSAAEVLSSDDFWEQAEKMAGNPVSYSALSLSDEYKSLEKKAPPVYKGPEASSDFLDQINAHLSPVHKSGVVNISLDPKAESNDLTMPISSAEGMDRAQALGQGTDVDRTIAVPQFAQKQNKMKSQSENHQPPKTIPYDGSETDEPIMLITKPNSTKVNSSQISIDASLAQAENLRMAQNRILDLEKEIERLRLENDEILIATEILRVKAEDYTTRISELEKISLDQKTDFKNETAILKGNLSYKESENKKFKAKIEELELRIKTDFKKIRIRERELENRLELIKAEKQAVAKSKDELLLELQRKNDQAKAEIDTYREKVQELNKSLENNQNQIKMTVRALRIALSHIEDKSDSSHSKKAS